MATQAGCEYALCQRAAELSVQTAAGDAPILVCGWHVTPVLEWGVVLEGEPVIDWLHRHHRPETAA